MAGHDAKLAALQARLARRPRDARLHLATGQALQHLARPLEALESYERALACDERLGPAWTLRGHLLRQAGRLADAATCFERAIACGEDATMHRFFLAALGRGALPGAPPEAYVRELFDEYADDFEADLVGALHYRGHVELAAPLAALQPAGTRSALDLGCGSGLAAPVLRARSRRLAGVDLAPRMLAAAARTGMYDVLLQEDLLAYLRATSERPDLIFCSDVFIYVGDLAPTLAAARRVVADDGVFAFSVERGEADTGFDLLPTLRYTHSEPYLRRLAAAHGWRLLALRTLALREAHGQAIDGFGVFLAPG